MTPAELDALEAATAALKLPLWQDHRAVFTGTREHVIGVPGHDPKDIDVIAGMIAACNALPALVARVRELEAGRLSEEAVAHIRALVVDAAHEFTGLPEDEAALAEFDRCYPAKEVRRG